MIASSPEKAPFVARSSLVLSGVIENLYAALWKGDTAVVAQHFAVDARFVVIADPMTVPSAGASVGRAAVCRRIDDINRRYHLGPACLDAVMIGNTTIGVRWTQHIGHPAAKPYAVFDHLRLESGYIAELQRFFDTMSLAADPSAERPRIR